MIFEQIYRQILRAYANIGSKNFAIKRSKIAILATKWSFERSLLNQEMAVQDDKVRLDVNLKSLVIGDDPSLHVNGFPNTKYYGLKDRLYGVSSTIFFSLNLKVFKKWFLVRSLFLFIGFEFLSGCAKPNTVLYKTFYKHLREPISFNKIESSKYFLVIFVEARHLDYTDNISFFKTVTKHPSNGSKNRDVGHAWIYLEGLLEGKKVFIKGGHSGERGIIQAKYFDGIMNYIDYGFANPKQEELSLYLYEPNPIKYLSEIQKDGFFELGSGRHKATFGMKIPLSEDQFLSMLDFIENYNYQEYSLIGNQCTSFAAGLASLAGINLNCQVTIPIEKEIFFNGEKIRFWEDPYYSELKIATPDILEKSLMEKVREGRGIFTIENIR